MTQGSLAWPNRPALASLSPQRCLASEVAHGRSASLLAPDDQVSMPVADLKLSQRATLVVDVADDRSRAVLAAAGTHASRRVIAAQQFNLGSAVHFHLELVDSPLTNLSFLITHFPREVLDLAALSA